jgi:poly-beta-1,6-N-acetyl-D-glucosamine synthase
MRKSSKYVLMTAARNEAAYLEGTIQTVLAQTILPEKWVIVSDGSTDSTDEIVISCAAAHNIIELVRITREDKDANYAAKIHALHAGYEKIRMIDHSFIGNLDADIELPRNYYELMIDRMHKDEKLGIVGGFIHEEDNGKYSSRVTNTVRSVAGAVQFFRRECYEGIQGLNPSKYGGEDSIASIRAEMAGWRVKSFKDIPVYHKKKNTAKGALKVRFKEGMMDYAMGSHPLFEIVKCIGRMREKPYIVTGVVRLTGYFYGTVRSIPRPVDDKFIRFIRRKQLKSLASL